MKSALPAQAYTSAEWFEREQNLLFKPLWQFVAPRMLLKKNHAFVRRRVAGVDVVVQNFNGELRAFENICVHRQSPLQQEPQGVRPLVCAYHAWSYDSQGKVANIPFEADCYGFDADERRDLALKSFKVQTFGNLVFVNVSESPISFDEQFSRDALLSLYEASALFDSEVLITTFPARFNWKLAYENLRDSLHPRFLHTKTVYKQVKFEARINSLALADAHHYRMYGSSDRAAHLERLRRFSGGGLNEPIESLPAYAWHEFVERYGNDDWYLNWLMYPNLHIASGSAGYSFIIEHHQPVSAHRTDLMVYYVTARKKRPYPTSAAVLMAHLEGAEKVLREDIDMMEKVQAALHDGAPRATTGAYEYENMMIERWYLDVMEGRHVL